MAATHPEWVASFFLWSPVPFPFSLCSLLCFIYPAQAQAFYDSVVEPRSQSLLATLQSIHALVPQPLFVLFVLLLDMPFATLGVGYMYPCMSLLTVVAVISVLLIRRKC